MGYHAWVGQTGATRRIFWARSLWIGKDSAYPAPQGVGKCLQPCPVLHHRICCQCLWIWSPTEKIRQLCGQAGRKQVYRHRAQFALDPLEDWGVQHPVWPVSHHPGLQVCSDIVHAWEVLRCFSLSTTSTGFLWPLLLGVTLSLPGGWCMIQPWFCLSALTVAAHRPRNFYLVGC